MADYQSPTVIEPTIPVSDVTPLERLLLEHVYEIEEEDDRLYLSEWDGPNDYPEIARDALERALQASRACPSRIGPHVATLLAASSDDPLAVPLDLIASSSDLILQDIVRRSSTLEYLAITTAFTCTKMRADGFGGAVTLVAADAIFTKSTTDILGEFLDAAGIAD